MASSATLPIGTIAAIVCNPYTPPTGWMFCDGSTFNTTTYKALASVLGSGNLPNLVGTTIIGAGAPGDSNCKQLTAYGASTVKLSLSQMPSHTHYGWGESGDAHTGFGFGSSDRSCYAGSGKSDGNNFFFASSFAGGTGTNDLDVTYNKSGTMEKSTTSSSWTDNDSFSVMQPSLAISYFIYAGDGE